jgi:pimeloyl-ACP methyl ester carboxylesterase
MNWRFGIWNRIFCAIACYFALVLASRALAGIPSSTCGQMIRGSVTLQYCFYPSTIPSTNRDLLYFFHGAGGSALSWEEASPSLYRRWRGGFFSAEKASPAVLSLSFGSAFQLSDYVTPNSGAFRALLVTEFMKALEAKLGLTPTRRLVTGMSMGGLNATYLWLRGPRGFFAKVAPLCPAITNLSPFANDAQIDTFLAHNHGLVKQNLIGVNQFFRSLFPTVAAWSANMPQAYLSGLSQIPSAALFVYDTHDDLGFSSGTSDFIASAMQRGFRVQSEAVDGGHCGSIMTETLADFLVSP